MSESKRWCFTWPASQLSVAAGRCDFGWRSRTAADTASAGAHLG